MALVNINGVLSDSHAGVTDHAMIADPSPSFTETGPIRDTKYHARKNSASLKSRESRIADAYASRHPSVGYHPHHLVADAENDEGTIVSQDSAFVGAWRTSAWGGCQVNCGTGSRFRTISCVDSAGNLLNENQCDPSLKPTNRQSCEGDCNRCDVNAKFLKGMGATSLLTSPLRMPADTSDVMCLVDNSFTCCSQAVEQQLLVSHYQLRRGLKAQTQHRETNIGRINEAYNNISEVLSSRIGDTSAAYDVVAGAVDDAPMTKNGDMQSMDLLRQSLLDVLNSRSDSLATAQSDIATAQSELLEQMDLMNSLPDDDTPVDDFVSAAGSSGTFFSEISDFASGLFSAESNMSQEPSFDDSSLGKSLVHKKEMNKPYSLIQVESKKDMLEEKKRVLPASMAQFQQMGSVILNLTDPTLRVFSKQCTESISNYFVSLGCASCNPKFPVQGRQAPELPVVQVPAATCSNLFSSCADTLVEAHQHMAEAIKALLNSHANLINLVNQVQPILDRVWSELNFDWLPGFSSLQVAKPDLTKMQCVKDLKVFSPYQVVNSTDFCNAYFTFASPKAFLKRISHQMDRGLFAMGKFTSCDRCLHNTLLFLADVLGPSAKGSLRLTLPSKAQAMISSCGAQPPPVPIPAGVPASMVKMTLEERVSPRVRFGLPIESIKGFSFYTNISQEIVNSASNSAPHEWKPRTLKFEIPQNGSTMRNIPGTKDTLKPMAGGPDAALQIHVMNMNCSKHSECSLQGSPSGMRPWWFCAHPNICLEQPGACTDEGLALLESGPKCVRGPCGSDLSAIDKACPVNALCPAQAGSLMDKPRPFFGEQYFSKFDLKIRDDDPLSIARGVCDCAFDSNGAITDQCMYARCLAYASLVENTMTCNTGLVAQCLEIKLGLEECIKDDTLSCTVKDMILTYPPDLPGECRMSNFALSSDTSSAGRMLSGFFALIVSAVMALMML